MSYRSGFVGVIGLPNSGKSTLVNHLVGEKVSIVSNKPQTTRRRSLGILTLPESQAIFVDAPGVLTASSGLNLFLVEEVNDVIAKSDVLMVVLNIDERNLDHLKEIIELAEKSGKPWVGVIHKLDLPEFHRPHILRMMLEEKNIPCVSGSSVEDKDGFGQKLVAKIMSLLPEAESPIYDKDLFTPATERELVAEIIREKCFESLHQEIPFGTAVRIVGFNDRERPVLTIRAEIIVAKPNHLGMVVGKEAKVIKQIGTDSRKDIEKLLGRKVFLDLSVSASKDWYKNPQMMKELGYVSQQH
jgi:GTP-binding protein Era